MAYTVVEWIQVIGLGGLLGAAGQLVRTIAGLKKLSDEASQKGLNVSDCIRPSQLVVSVLIGAVAGLLGAISLGLDPTQKLTASQLTPLLGFGYAGSDFIEAFMKREGKAGGGTVVGPADPTRVLSTSGSSSTADQAVG